MMIKNENNFDSNGVVRMPLFERVEPSHESMGSLTNVNPAPQVYAVSPMQVYNTMMYQPTQNRACYQTNNSAPQEVVSMFCNGICHCVKELNEIVSSNDESALVRIITLLITQDLKLIVRHQRSDVSLFSLFFIILFGYCTVKVVFANIKRGGILLCQIAVGSLYLFSVPRGFTDGFYSWMKQVIATCLTAFLQTTILYIGLLTYTQHALLAVGICLSANEVSRIAQMFGLDTSVRVNMMSVSSTVSLGTRAVKAFKKK